MKSTSTILNHEFPNYIFMLCMFDRMLLIRVKPYTCFKNQVITRGHYLWETMYLLLFKPVTLKNKPSYCLKSVTPTVHYDVPPSLAAWSVHVRCGLQTILIARLGIELFAPQADNDLRKFLATREQALNNREGAGSDQDISREIHDDSERQNNFFWYNISPRKKPIGNCC